MNDDFKERVREATDMVALIGAEVKLSRAGNEWVGCCPFHEEKTPSFHVVPAKGFWKCHGTCGATGDVFEWVMRRHGVAFPEALRQLAQAANLRPPGPDGFYSPRRLAVAVDQPAADTGRRWTADVYPGLSSSSEAGRYLLGKRCITPDVAGRYDVREVPRDKLLSYLDWLHKEGRIDDAQRAVLRGGGAVAFLSVEIWQRENKLAQEKEWFATPRYVKWLLTERTETEGGTRWAKWERRDPAGVPSVLYGMTAIPSDCKRLVICEGEIDAMSWAVYGIWAVSVPNGASSLDWIERAWPWLERFEAIYVSFDMDAAGQAKVEECVRRLGPARASIVSLPERPAGQIGGRYKDANECLQAGVKVEAMEQALAEAREVRPTLLKTATDFRDEIYHQFYPSGKEQAGLPFLFGDEFPFRLRYGEVTVWTGFPGHGKTQFLNHLMVHLVATQSERACLASLEMRPDVTFKRILKVATGAPKPFQQDDWATLDSYLSWLGDRIWICHVQGAHAVDGILLLWEYARRRYGVRQFVLDSLMMVTMAYGEDGQYAEENEVVQRLCDFADRHVCHVHLVAHTKKPQDKARERSFPRMYDIQGSASIVNKAFNVVVVWRNKRKEDELAPLTDKADLASHGGPPLDSDELAEMKRLMHEEHDAYLLVEKQRNGDALPVKRLWFERGSQQYHTQFALPAGAVQYISPAAADPSLHETEEF